MSVYIRASQLSLDVPVFLQPERRIDGWAGAMLGAAFSTPKRSLARLLDGISFTLEEGDRLAILGRNGAGKSTLLRVLNRVYLPTQGQLEISGSCQALLNMSLGFNGLATVQENIFLRGVAMGLDAGFLRSQVDAILDFSGLREKSHHRLRTLSSGQRMRLGFAISTSIQHDIMLMDEWVGAGDADFMAKAKARMQDRVGGSKIVVLASHSTGLLRDICNKGIVLERGRLLYAGEIVSSLRYYHQHLARLRATGEAVEEEEASRVYGALEQLEPVPKKKGQFLLHGWMVDDAGRIPEGLAIEIGGYRYPAKIIERLARTDVAKHMGLADSRCGFIAKVTIRQADTVEDLAQGFQALGGISAEHANVPLRLTPAVRVALRLATDQVVPE